MRILGIDPGSRVTGWGIVEHGGWDLSLVAHGALRTSTERTLAERLLELTDGLAAVVEEHAPDVAAVEQVFTARNARAALVLGQARGALLVAAARAGLPTFEYTPMQVKNAVTGYGRAEKKQVQLAVATILGMREPPRPQDAADALAVATCHASASRLARHAAALPPRGGRP